MASRNLTEPQPQALNPTPSGTSPLLRHGTNAVAYHIPNAVPTDNASPLKTTIVLPRHSAWTSGLHFHGTHTEYLRLIKGAIFVELNGATKLISALEAGEISKSTGDFTQKGLVVEVPRYARQNWGRLERYLGSAETVGLCTQRSVMMPEDWTEEVVVEEWTDPSDIDKALFFWNLNNIITAPSEVALSSWQKTARSVLGSYWINLQLFQVFWELDNWPVFFDLRKLPFKGNLEILARVTDVVEIATSFIVLFVARLSGLILGLRAVEPRRTPDALWEAYRESRHDL